jgi:hypothetical protein
MHRLSCIGDLGRDVCSSLFSFLSSAAAVVATAAVAAAAAAAVAEV